MQRGPQPVFAGGYNDVTLQVSPWVIQKQLTIKGSWTCCESFRHLIRNTRCAVLTTAMTPAVTELETLCRKLVEWDVHPDALVSHTMPLSRCPEAFDLFSRGRCSKVAIVFD